MDFHKRANLIKLNKKKEKVNDFTFVTFLGGMRALMLDFTANLLPKLRRYSSSMKSNLPILFAPHSVEANLFLGKIARIACQFVLFLHCCNATLIYTELPTNKYIPEMVQIPRYRPYSKRPCELLCSTNN